MSTNTEQTATTDREIVMTRTVSAPRELVFEVWTNPDHLVKWWGPQGFTTTIHEIDVRPGGVWRYIMHGPDGTDYDNLITYHEVVRPERLRYAHGATDDDPEHFQGLTTFVDRAGKTEITMCLTFPTVEDRNKAAEYGIEGGNQTLDRLEDLLATLQTG